MIHAPPRLLLLVVLCASVLVTGCRASVQKRRFIPPRLTASALFVQSFGFRWPEPAYRSFELSQRIISTADEKVGRQVLLFGPSEFKVHRTEDNGWAGSDAVTRLPAVRVRPEHAIVLRPWAEKRIASSRKEVLDAKGKPVGMGAVEEVTYQGHVEIIHPSTQTVLVEVGGEATVDPFAERRPEDEADPAPELTRLMQALTTTALAELEGHLTPPAQPREIPVTVAFNPQVAVTYAEEGRPSLEALTASDPLEGELLRQGRLLFANPGLPQAEAMKLSKLPGGLYVLQGQPGAPLQPGDLILEVAGEPAQPQTLQRARFREGVLLKVRRADGTDVELML